MQLIANFIIAGTLFFFFADNIFYPLVQAQ